MTRTPRRAHPLPVRVEQVGDPVQPDRGLAGPRRALHADGLVRAGPDDVVLVRLDGGDDVAHRPRPRPLDLLEHDAADPARGRGAWAGEVLVLVRGKLAAVEAEPPAPVQPHRLALAGAVERPGHRGPPVDHHRVAARIVHVPAADVEPLAAARAVAGTRAGARGRLLLPGRPAVVQPAEEQRGIRQVAQRLGTAVEVGLQVLLGYRVTAERAERQDILPHQPQEPA